MIVRNLIEGEELPIKTGLEPLKIDPPWAWVAEEQGRIVGILLAAPCHGAVMLMRMVGSADAPVIWVRKVLKQAGKDMVARGYLVCFVYFDMHDGTERRLAKLLMGHGKEGRRAMVADRHAMCITALEDWAS